MTVVMVLMSLKLVQTFGVLLDSSNVKIKSVYSLHKYVMAYLIVKTILMKKTVEM